MTIDERLEKLADRHEALTQSVELLTADIRELSAQQKQMGKMLGDIMEGMARLLHVAQIHEQRVERLEGSQS